MGNVPFTVYDALGYLSAGAIVLVAATIAIIGELATDLTLPTAIAVGVGSYMAGHLVSSIASWLLDRVMFNEIWGMGRPERILFGSKTNTFPWKALFRRYHHPLPESIQRRVMNRANEAGIDEEGLLLHCEAVVHGHDRFGPRVDRLEMMTIFLRNSAMAFVGAAAILALAPDEHAIELQTARGGTASLSPDLLAGLSFLAAVILLFRYVFVAGAWRRKLFVLYAEAD